jgi:hypothetical protein
MLECVACHDPVCKSCAQFLEENRFSFLSTVPEILQGGAFCPICFEAKVQPEIQAYEADLERAKDVIVFLKKQTKETRHVKRLEKPVVVEHCPDREETLLRLAFFAVKAGFNSMVDVEISSVKVRGSGNRQTSDWSGTGIPAHVDLSKIPKDRSIWQNPN